LSLVRTLTLVAMVPFTVFLPWVWTMVNRHGNFGLQRMWDQCAFFHIFTFGVVKHAWYHRHNNEWDTQINEKGTQW